MFTGIIEEIGKVKEIRKSANSALLKIEAEKVLDDVKIGDSIATNGVCLTVIEFDTNSFTADVMNETLKASSLGDLKTGDALNLERAAQLNTRLGGHLVSGHVDGLGTISEIKSEGIAQLYRITVSDSLLKYMIRKGSIAIDGISLTIQELNPGSIVISIIPHTEDQTNLSQRKIGDKVNIEADMIAKYTERLLGFNSKNKSELEMNDLIQKGFI